MLSKSEEDYLKAIYSLLTKDKHAINTNLIAEKLETKPSSVTDMLKKLSKKELVIYKKYKGVFLSEKGQKIATSIVRKHRLWETFLVEKLNFSWDEVHDVAEQLEHIKSDKLITNLDTFLGFPKQDPHGDPIPNENGIMRIENTTLLSDASINASYKISGIKNSSTLFLNYLDNLRLKINSEINILKKSEFDSSFLIQINKNQSLSLSKKVCDNLYVKTI